MRTCRNTKNQVGIYQQLKVFWHDSTWESNHNLPTPASRRLYVAVWSLFSPEWWAKMAGKLSAGAKLLVALKCLEHKLVISLARFSQSLLFLVHCELSHLRYHSHSVLLSLIGGECRIKRKKNSSCSACDH